MTPNPEGTYVKPPMLSPVLWYKKTEVPGTKDYIFIFTPSLFKTLLSFPTPVSSRFVLTVLTVPDTLSTSLKDRLPP